MPYSPDSLDVHNPNAPRPDANSNSEPIVGWHGQEIDPSDHLPVDSWAPEPEKKTPTKTYGLGRDRDFGPRAAQPGTGARLSKDTVINVRLKDRSSTAESPASETTTSRNRLTKRAGPPPEHRHSAIDVPARNHESFAPVPNPYEHSPRYDRGARAPSPNPYAGNGAQPPSIPPKVPLSRESPQHGYAPQGSPGHGYAPQHHSPSPHGGHHGYDHAPVNSQEALSREISAIDLGPSRNRTSLAGGSSAAYVPVRSHRDRSSYY